MTSLIDGFVSHLEAPSMDLRSKLNIASELRDSIELNQITTDQEHFVTQLLPQIIKTIEQTPVSMVSTSAEHKLRHCLLDCLCRLQPTETFKPAVVTIMQLLMRVLHEDNEENGILCLKIFSNLHKAYRGHLVDYVKPFFDLLIEIIGNVPQILRDLFDVNLDEQKVVEGSVASPGGGENDLLSGMGNDLAQTQTQKPKEENSNSTNNTSNNSSTTSVGTPSANSPSGSSTPSNTTQNVLFPATKSFKVLIECPIIIVSLFHTHRQLTTQAVPLLIPHIIELLTLEAAPQASEHATAAAQDTIFAGVAPAIRMSPHRKSFHDFVVSQIKAMSFISFIVRTLPHVLQNHLNLIPNFLIRLLKDCPPEDSFIRRELIVALRHMINTEHRMLFLSKINVLLEEKVLIGYGLSCHVCTRFIGYSVVADLIYHGRNELNMSQIWQAVRVYTKILLDPTLNNQTHVMSLRLLVNILDRLSSMQKPEQGRQLVSLVMKVVIDRLEMVNVCMEPSTEAIRRYQKILKVQQDVPHGDIKEAKYIYRSLVVCARNLMFALKATNPPPRQRMNVTQWQDLARGFTSDDTMLLRKMLREVIIGLKFYQDDPASIKSLIDNIVVVYTMIDTATLSEVFEHEISFISKSIMQNPELLHFSYLLNGNELTSNTFCNVMLNHLMTRLQEVGQKEGGAQLLRLFRQCFTAVNAFPAVNEPIVLLHLRDIIVKSLAYANDAEEPQRYFALLQHLFRTLGGGRFDNVYKTMLPLLHFLLETLNKRLAVARTEEEKNRYAELCLTVPVRLSLMVPHLSFLIRPLAQALKATNNPELTVQGLRTLELCVDNLTPVYFDPHIAPIMPEILPALWNLLKPLPFDHKLSHTTLRVLGKLGGRSRAYIKPPTDLKYVKALDQDTAAVIQMKSDTAIPLRITPSIKVALQVLEAPTSAYAPEYHEHAFKLIAALAMKLIPSNTTGLTPENVKSNSEEVSVPLKEHLAAADDAKESKKDNTELAKELRAQGDIVENDPETFLPSKNDKKVRMLETELTEDLFKGLFLACGHPTVAEHAEKLLSQISEHLVMLEMREFNDDRANSFKTLNMNDKEKRHYVSPHTFLTAVVFGLTHWLPNVAQVAENQIRKMVSTGKCLCGEDTDAPRLPPMFRVMYAKLSHACFDEAWYTKLGAVRGLGILLKENKVPELWMRQRTNELARTLFFVIKDTSPMGGFAAGNVPSVVSKEATSLLLFILAQVEHVPEERYFTSLIGFLAYELEGACKLCRETSQQALEFLGESTKVGVSKLLEKVTDVFLNPIFMKPLRALPFPMQIGYTDCISYCMNLPDTFLKFNEKLTRMLEEALALVDADDESLITAHRGLEYTTGQQLTELRVVCINLLALAVVKGGEEFSTQNPTIKNRLIAVFFKSMSGGPQPAIDAAYNGLKSILQLSSRIPKDLLQSGLKPILLPLSDFKRLNCNILDCLTRLLEVLTYNFRVEIGVKVLDHLVTYSEPNRLLPLSYKVLEGDPRVQLGVSMINTFHMLPSTAHIFLNDLVTNVVKIEVTLRRTQGTPYREPLAKYLDKYPSHAFTFFAEHLNRFVYGKLFADMLTRAPALAKYTIENIEELCTRIMTQTNEEEQCVGVCNLISVVGCIDVPRKILVNLVNSIGDIVRASSSFKTANSPLEVAVPYAVDELQRVVVKFLQKQQRPPKIVEVKSEEENGEKKEAGDDDNKQDVEMDGGDDDKQEVTDPVDFELIEILVSSVSNAGLRIIPNVTEYLWATVINTEDAAIRQCWLNKAIPYVLNVDLHTETKQYIMLIANMILMIEGEKNKNLDQLINNSDWVNKFHNMVWLNADKLIPPEGKPGNPLGSGLGVSTLDVFIIRLLEMSILLVEHASAQIFSMRKSVIKFGWRYITVDDAISKLSAYVQINYFVQAFDTLPKIVVQIYLALLKMSFVDARSLVQQALDVLATVIVQRVGLTVWARAPRRVLSEDGHGISGVTNVCLFLARHSELFFPFRELYVQYVVSSMARLSYMANQTLDVDLAELLANWEQQRYDEREGGKTEGYDMPHATREAVITYLVRFITAQPASRPRDPSSCERVLAALDKLLKLWPDSEVRLNFFDRSLVQTDFAGSQATLNASIDALKVVDLALKHKPESWITENIMEISQLLEKPLHCNIPAIHEVLKPVLHTALVADTDDRLLLRQVVAAIVEHLAPTTSSSSSNATATANTTTTSTTPAVTGAAANAATNTSTTPAVANNGPRISWVYMATLAVEVKPNCLDEHFSLVVKGMSRMNKEKADSSSSIPSDVFISGLKLLANRVSFLGDQRRSFLSLVASVIDRIVDKDICMFILEMVDNWVFGNEPFPTIKEKAALLHKLLSYKDVDLMEKYFDIIIRIFEDGRLRQTELPSRLEHPFLVGCTAANITVRTQLLTILNNSIDDSIWKRLVYVLCEQNWEPLADKLWLCQALQLLLTPLKPASQKLDVKYLLGFAPVSVLEPVDKHSEQDDGNAMELEPSKYIITFTEERKKFMGEIDEITAFDFTLALKNLMYLDDDLVQQTWIDVFSAIYQSPEFPSKERHELVKGMVTVLAKEYHIKQADARPNVVQCLLSGLAVAGEQLPPQLTQYLATNYDAWYTAIQISENIMTTPHSDSERIAETNEDVLAELYAALGEDDHFYGLWRTRSKFTITSSALSYEQCGMWQKAMQLYENAQIRARSGSLPYGESEYGLWEDHWILCAEKLQHWEVLTDIAKHEGFTDLLLECQWRLADWVADRDALESTIKTVMDVPTPRRQVFETFLSLQGIAKKSDTLQHLSQNCDEGIQLALRKWHSLPRRFTPAHGPLLHTFQQYVEFMEATQVYTSLQSTTSLNVEAKSQELRGVMQAWHDRLPNAWDDINWWGDLAAWRQHVFGVINRTYLPLFPQLQSSQGSGQNNGNAAMHSAAYRGYHEIAWTINRFAHTARKQNLTDVCTTQLSKIYTLPNIEIQEAFLKLREQAKCHLQNPNELATGLDVISNTNLAFFSNSQKAEFFALKGLSLGKLGQYDAAYDTLSTAVQVDMRLPNAWDAWGEFSDRRFKETPDNYMFGASAITCYLQAIFLYKSSKSRKLIGRVLWLLGLEDPEGKLGEAFEDYKGETATWYWVTYIPQMLTSLSTKEGKYTSRILIKIAKAFPQSLHFHLRTAKEEYLGMQRNIMRAKAIREAQAKQSPTKDQNGDDKNADNENDEKAEDKERNLEKQPWEYIDEITGVLKTAYPLLALSLETFIDQIYQRFKWSPEEEAYRLIMALHSDVMNYVNRKVTLLEDEKIPPYMESNISKYSEGIISDQLRPQYDIDFKQPNMNLHQYITRLRKWRQRLEERLDARPATVHLESISPSIVEYNYQTFEEVEVPGQSMDLHDDNRYFYKIGRFLPLADFVRAYTNCHRRITIQATDGSLHPFSVQYTVAKNSRREDRVTQMFKILSEVMQHRTETRRRQLKFTLPNVTSLNQSLRLIQDDKRYVSFYQIYEKYCRDNNQSKDAPFDYQLQQMRAAMDPKLPKPDTVSVKVEIMAAIQAKLVPKTIMKDYFMKRYRTYEDFWLFRRQFAYQYACVAAMTVILSVNSRYPYKFSVNMASGNVWATEMFPIVPFSGRAPTFLNGESVAFRFTPNLQTLMGPQVTEGLFTPIMMIIGKSLTEPEFDFQQFLPLFVRDELISYFTNQLNPEQRLPRDVANYNGLMNVIKHNVDMIERRAGSLCHPPTNSSPNQPANQSVIDLITHAVNPRSLASTDMLWMPWY